jgi:hypothetical protein
MTVSFGLLLPTVLGSRSASVLPSGCLRTPLRAQALVGAARRAPDACRGPVRCGRRGDARTLARGARAGPARTDPSEYARRRAQTAAVTVRGPAVLCVARNV